MDYTVFSSQKSTLMRQRKLNAQHFIFMSIKFNMFS